MGNATATGHRATPRETTKLRGGECGAQRPLKPVVSISGYRRYELPASSASSSSEQRTPCLACVR
uniref:Uncharacterized protein n=1 Tax=Arundo donax TaxID=35708 RepID=A0A0A8Z778_ARUDO